MAGPKASPQTSLFSVSHTVSALWKSYLQQTPDRLKFIDAFLAFIVLSGVFQFVYCVLVTNFPFNAFLAGYAVARRWLCCFWLTGSVASRVRLDSLSSPLRSGRRSTPKIAQSSKRCHPRGGYSPLFCHRHAWSTRIYRAFADFALGSIVLHFFVFNFLG